MADFKREIAKMRAEGATQADIDATLDEFEEAYASSDDAEGKLLMAILMEAVHPPHRHHHSPSLAGSPVSASSNQPFFARHFLCGRGLGNPLEPNFPPPGVDAARAKHPLPAIERLTVDAYKDDGRRS